MPRRAASSSFLQLSSRDLIYRYLHRCFFLFILSLLFCIQPKAYGTVISTSESITTSLLLYTSCLFWFGLQPKIHVTVYASQAFSESSISNAISDHRNNDYNKNSVRWTIVKDFNFHNNSYVLHWHPHRHSHLNESFADPSAAANNLASGASSHNHFRPLHIVVLAPTESNEEYSLSRIAPAIVAAVRSIQREANETGKYAGWERGAQIDFVDTKCSSAIGPLVAFDYYIRGKVDVFLGPVCPYVLAPVARYTSYWDVPHLTSSGQVSMFDDKNTTFRILTRMNGSFSRMGQFFNQILNRFQWKTVFFMYTDHNDRSKGHSLCYFSLASVFMSMGPKAVELKRSFDEEEDFAYEDYLRDASMKSRIIIMCAKKNTVRRIMITAYQLGMVQTGEYVFINVELTTGLDASQRLWERSNDTAEENRIAKEAYTALIRVTPKMPKTETMNSFLESVAEISENEFEGEFRPEEVSTYATAFHEAVYLYALGLNETIHGGGFRYPSGTTITRNMWNRTFSGIAGNVTIDANGDRLVDYTLFDMNPLTGRFEAVMIFDSRQEEFVELPGKKIHWANDRLGPPPDIPPCGFDGELCLPDDNSQRALIIAAVTLTFALIMVIALFLFLYRRYKLEAELLSMTWKIRQEDILPTSGFSQTAKLGSRFSLARTSISSETLPANGNRGLTFNGPQLFSNTGLYRGVVVSLKQIEKSRVEMTRSLLIELKNMKNLQHNHIVTFIGACLEPPQACFLVTEYCPKGSLQDILENDEIKLDWMFRYSLMHDIIKGMAYLHGSEIHVHGNLKSSNCVVDSRFVLKITDFGLNPLRQSNPNSSNRLPLPNEVDATHYAYWRQKFWTAPELLRLWLKTAECNGGSKQQQLLQSKVELGTQKGDVYSFAIICHEIILRQGPFYMGEELDLSPKEIIFEVCEHMLRPRLDEQMADEAVLAMVHRCWHEDPNERPDFVTLQSIIRRINKENESSNILDNLLKRMEQYANNLEALVQERTESYLEEKRKAEDLLYQLLPKSVASQLIRNESVRAEAYDSVTIYFSDIVGFTKLSAQSTPMQVVNVLNDLYTCFDSTIENFDVYKVETIGDAYMVVSGLPVRNGERHAREIAKMSLTLLKAVRSFVIRHRPGEQLMLRIGMHTGSVVAGVVGLKMPRYCLFGDTVNTASRMESTGLPLRIHVSESTKLLLDKQKEFELTLRGEIDVKGKGKMTTYWLMGLLNNNNNNNNNNKNNNNINNFSTNISNIDTKAIDNEITMTPSSNVVTSTTTINGQAPQEQPKIGHLGMAATQRRSSLCELLSDKCGNHCDTCSEHVANNQCIESSGVKSGTIDLNEKFTTDCGSVESTQLNNKAKNFIKFS